MAGCGSIYQLRWLILVSFCITPILSGGVPVFIWSRTQHDLPDAYVGQQITKDEFRADYVDKILHNSNHDVLVFLQDKLSLADVTENADVYNTGSDGGVFKQLKELVESDHSAQLPDVLGVVDVLNEIKKAFGNTVHELHAPYDLSDLQLSGTGRHLVIVHLPPTGTHGTDGFKRSLHEIDDVIASVHLQYTRMGRDFTALYTAKKPTRDMVPDVNVGRKLLAKDTINSSFINMGNCIYFYARSIIFDFVAIDSKKRILGEMLQLNSMRVSGMRVQANDTNNETMQSVTGSCSNATMVVDWKLSEDLHCGLTKFKIALQIEEVTKPARYWKVVNVTLDYKFNNTLCNVNGTHINITSEGTDLPMDASFIQAPARFSYHCTQPRPLQQIRNSSSDLYLAVIQLEGFQMQYGNMTGRFGPPDDCVPVFTVPILSGILVSLILVAILAYGIGMIASIGTIDRFDDPKGKTITVNTATE